MALRVSWLVLLPLLALPAACAHRSEQSAAPRPSASAAPASASAAPSGTLAIGERISQQPLVSLVDIAKNPDHYANQVVATTGKVTAVCQEMGCWMEMQDESGRAHVRMHGHSFFVPKTASGHKARVLATVLPSASAKSEEDCTDGKSLAKVQLDATGIELD
jgi:hypothetical protein